MKNWAFSAWYPKTSLKFLHNDLAVLVRHTENAGKSMTKLVESCIVLWELRPCIVSEKELQHKGG